MVQQTKLTGALFLSKLITQYAQLHEKTVGDGAKQYIRQLGLRTGEWIERFYEDSIDGNWTPDQYAEVIVDLKNSIGGHFSISEVHPDHVVVTATGCPFGDVVQDAPHLCNMTSTVFGGIAARRFGYGKVNLRKRIAVGDSGCEVVIYFQPTDKEDGDEYKDLPVTPVNGNPFLWEEEAIVALNEELEKSDKMITTLMEELEELRAQVRDGSAQSDGDSSVNVNRIKK